MTLIERARLCVAARPPAIETQGGNATTFSVACLLVWGFALEPSEALPLMLEYNRRCEPEWREGELERMLRNALTWGQHKHPRGYLIGDRDAERGNVQEVERTQPRKRKPFSLKRLEAIQDGSLPKSFPEWKAYLAERSVREPGSVTPEEYLDALYERGEKILLFAKMWGTQGDFGREIGGRTWELAQSPHGRARPLAKFPERSPEGLQFLMQPVDGKWRPTKGWDGKPKMSRRTSASVTRWPYILLESDSAPHPLWLNALVRMKLRVVSIASSGGRSLHALVRIDAETQDELLAQVKDPAAEEILSLLGCDRQALHGMVYPRLPNTWREGKRVAKLDRAGEKIRGNDGRTVLEFRPFRDGAARQSLLYFNPDPERGKSIREGLIFERGATGE